MDPQQLAVTVAIVAVAVVLWFGVVRVVGTRMLGASVRIRREDVAGVPAVVVRVRNTKWRSIEVASIHIVLEDGSRITRNQGFESILGPGDILEWRRPAAEVAEALSAVDLGPTSRVRGLVTLRDGKERASLGSVTVA